MTIIKKIKTNKRAIRNREQYNENYDVLSLRISELSNSIVHYKSDKIVLNDGIIEFEGLRIIIKLGIKKTRRVEKL